MRLATRLRHADPLAGTLPEALAPPALPAEWADDSVPRPARSHTRRRRTAVGAALAAAALGAVLLVVLLPGSAPRHDEVAQAFTVSTASGGPASAPLTDASVAVLHRRLASLDLRDWSADSPGAGRIQVSCADCGAGTTATAVLAAAAPGKLVFYDWEANVLDAQCRARPDDAAVTGGTAAGQPGAGTMSHYAAVLRAARCPTGDGDPSSHAAPDYYAVDRARLQVLSGPEPSRTSASAAAGGQAADAQVVRVLPGTAIVEAEDAQDTPREADTQWYVLRDRPALTGADVIDPRAEANQVTGAPTVTLRLTAHGQRTLHATTRRIARRGAAQLRPGIDGASAAQHFAIVLDGRLLAVPYVDPQQNPDGIDARSGVQFAGGLTLDRARTVAALLKSGVLPARLSPSDRPG
jgi:SecD/SecF fusion protein